MNIITVRSPIAENIQPTITLNGVVITVEPCHIHWQGADYEMPQASAAVEDSDNQTYVYGIILQEKTTQTMHVEFILGTPRQPRILFDEAVFNRIHDLVWCLLPAHATEIHDAEVNVMHIVPST